MWDNITNNPPKEKNWGYGVWRFVYGKVFLRYRHTIYEIEHCSRYARYSLRSNQLHVHTHVVVNKQHNNMLGDTHSIQTTSWHSSSHLYYIMGCIRYIP